MPTTRRALSENEDMDASQPLKRSQSAAAAAALFEDLPSPAADPASADPCPRTLAFARSELEARGESHGLAHAKRVRALALAIYAELGGDDARVVEVAALLHDVCDHKYVDPATDAGRACIERRDRFLAEALSEADAAAVLQIVGAVSYSREAKALKKGEEPAWAALPESIRVLRHCVSDADKIDAIGVRGLERCAAYARERGVRGSLNVAREVAEHCDEKLLRLRDEYVRTLVDFIEILPPSIVIERITGEAPSDFFVGPTWALDKSAVRNAVDREFEQRDSWQGKWYRKRS